MCICFRARATHSVSELEHRGLDRTSSDRRCISLPSFHQDVFILDSRRYSKSFCWTCWCSARVDHEASASGVFQIRCFVKFLLSGWHLFVFEA